MGAHHRWLHPAPEFATGVWLALSTPLIFLLFWGLRAEATRTRFLAVPRWHNLLNLPIVVLACLPYFGLQSQGSFTMFSNLRVLGAAPNHLILSNTWHRHTPELIRILSTNHPDLEAYASPDWLITEHEVRRSLTQLEQDFFLVAEYQGEAIWIARYRGSLTPHPLTEPLPWLTGHFIRYKPVSTRMHSPCAW